MPPNSFNFIITLPRGGFGGRTGAPPAGVLVFRELGKINFVILISNSHGSAKNYLCYLTKTLHLRNRYIEIRQHGGSFIPLELK